MLLFWESDGYCITPSNATKILSLLTTAFDKVNVVVLPSAVNVSTLLSEISNVGKLFATRFPKITSEEDGAVKILWLNQRQFHIHLQDLEYHVVFESHHYVIRTIVCSCHLCFCATTMCCHKLLINTIKCNT